MNWLDLVIIAILLAVVLVEVSRGFSRALFDFIALLTAVHLSPPLGSSLAGALHFSPDVYANAGIMHAVSFVIVGGLLVFGGNFIYSMLQFSTDFFEPILGGILGVGIGIIICHALVSSVAVTGVHMMPVSIANSSFGSEFLTFDSYHRFMGFLYNFNK